MIKIQYCRTILLKIRARPGENQAITRQENQQKAACEQNI